MGGKRTFDWTHAELFNRSVTKAKFGDQRISTESLFNTPETSTVPIFSMTNDSWKKIQHTHKKRGKKKKILTRSVGIDFDKSDREIGADL